mgnify:CR=1 FL=1
MRSNRQAVAAYLRASRSISRALPLALRPQRILLDHFWDARGFFIDAPGDDVPSGEGNIWPFWTGVVTEPSVLRQALDTLEERGFANPYPLKYEPVRRADSAKISGPIADASTVSI